MSAVDLTHHGAARRFARTAHEASDEDLLARLESLHASDHATGKDPLIPRRGGVAEPPPRLEMQDHLLRPNSEYLARRDRYERSGARFLLDDVEMTRSIPLEG